MKPLLSMKSAQDLDRELQAAYHFAQDGLMEIASLRLWEQIKKVLETHAEKRGIKAQHLSVAAICGKGDNAGDALAMLRHARMEGYEKLHAVLPPSETLKENARLNYERGLQAGIRYQYWAQDRLDSLADFLKSMDVIIDAVLGTGVRGPAEGQAAEMIGLLNTISANGYLPAAMRPLVLSIDIPSGLGDMWKADYPCVRADMTFCIFPLKEALFMPDARRYAGTVIPIHGVFPKEDSVKKARAFIEDTDQLASLLPQVMPWAHKMQRGRVAILAGSMNGAGAALHCVRGAAAAGAGYIALFCDSELFSPFLSAAGDRAIVRPYSEENFKPEEWDVVIVGPGWGRTAERKMQLERVLASDVALVLDADGLRLFANLAESRMNPSIRNRSESGSSSAPLVLLPHPGEMKDLLKVVAGSSGMSLPADQVLSVSSQFGAVVALRAVTTHIAKPGGPCIVHDGFSPGLGIAGSGDVLAGIAGGLLARWIAFRRVGHLANATGGEVLVQDAFHAVRAGVLAHSQAGRMLFHERGWFSPADIADSCSRLLSQNGAGNAEI